MTRLSEHLIRPAVRLVERLGGLVLPPGSESGPVGNRVVMYSSSIVGLGHTARVCRIAEALLRARPETDVLIISDSGADVLDRLAPNAAHLRLPTYQLESGEAGRHEERAGNLSLPKRELRNIRAGLITAALHGFRPSVFVADTLPHGKRDELLPALRTFSPSGRGCRRVLLVRDIPCTADEPSKVNLNDRAHARHLGLYDRILVAGDRTFFDVEQELAWPEWLGRRTRYIGYVIPQAARRPDVATAPAKGVPGHPTRIVVSFGGGWESDAASLPILDAFRTLRDEVGHGLHLYLALGPSASPDTRDRVLGRASDLVDAGAVEIHDFDEHFPERLANADLAILQGGSTVFQVLDGDLPILIYARDWKTREQEERIRRVTSFPGIALLAREDLEDPRRLATRLGAILSAERPKRATGISFDGLENAVSSIVELLPPRR